jgi:hypothetical protein
MITLCTHTPSYKRGKEGEEKERRGEESKKD